MATTQSTNGSALSLGIASMPEEKLDPIASKALAALKTTAKQEEAAFTEYLRINNRESEFQEVIKLINRDKNLSEAERQVLKYKGAKVALEYLQDLDQKASPFSIVTEALAQSTEALKSSIDSNTDQGASTGDSVKTAVADGFSALASPLSNLDQMFIAKADALTVEMSKVAAAGMQIKTVIEEKLSAEEGSIASLIAQSGANAAQSQESLLEAMNAQTAAIATMQNGFSEIKGAIGSLQESNRANTETLQSALAAITTAVESKDTECAALQEAVGKLQETVAALVGTVAELLEASQCVQPGKKGKPQKASQG